MNTFQLHENFITRSEQDEVMTWALSVKENCVARVHYLGQAGVDLPLKVAGLPHTHIRKREGHTYAHTHAHTYVQKEGGSGRRMSEEVDVFEPVPWLISELRDRMETTLDLTNANRLTYKVVIHEMDASTIDHVDKCIDYPKQNGRPTFFRAVLLVQAATQGGIFTVNNMPVNFPELSLVSYLGDDPHGVTTVTQGERILLRANWGYKIG